MTAGTETPQTDEQRREFVQASAVRYYRRKVFASRLFLGMTSLGLVLAMIPLFSIVYNVLARGIPYLSWTFLSTPQLLPDNNHQHHLGGIANAITGTVEIFGLAVLIAIPLSVIVAIALYEAHGKVMNAFRTLLEVMVGMPSILFGVFIYAYVVVRMHYQLTQLAGALALAILMIPLMAISGELALRAVPQVLVEAALALGAKKSTVMRKVVLPYALPRMWTGIMLSASRGVGETAPILFVIGANLLVNWNVRGQASSLPTTIFNDLQSNYGPQRDEVWGIALVLIAAVLILNLTSRYLVARANRGRT